MSLMIRAKDEVVCALYFLSVFWRIEVLKDRVEGEVVLLACAYLLEAVGVLGFFSGTGKEQIGDLLFFSVEELLFELFMAGVVLSAEAFAAKTIHNAPATLERCAS